MLVPRDPSVVSRLCQGAGAQQLGGCWANPNSHRIFGGAFTDGGWG